MMVPLVRIICILSLFIFFLGSTTFAAPITVNRPFHFRDNRSANSVGIQGGDLLTFGAVL